MEPNDPRDNYVAREDIAKALEANSNLTILIAQEAREARTLVRGALEALEVLRDDLRTLDREVDAWELVLQQVREQLRTLEVRLEGATKQLEGLSSAQTQERAAQTSLAQARVTSRYTLWGILIPALLALLGTVITLIYQSREEERKGDETTILDDVATDFDAGDTRQGTNSARP